MGQQAIAGDRNPYYEGQFGAESPEDTAACPALVAERDALQKKVAALQDVVHKECDFGRDTGIRRIFGPDQSSGDLAAFSIGF